MTAGNFIKKGIMPLILMGILTWIGQYIYMENGCVDWFRFILVYGIPCWNSIYVYHCTNEMEFVWNGRNGSFLCDSWGIVWICVSGSDCSTGSLVCNNVSIKLLGTT